VEQVSVRVPQFPQPTCRVCPGVHTPCPPHAPDDHWQAALQVSVSVPQLPQSVCRVAPGEHAPSPSHEQWPPTHANPAPHCTPHWPQFIGSLSVLASQPFVGSWSQSAHGAMQTSTWQWPPAHRGVACWTSQTLPHPPQFATLTSVCVSQPSVPPIKQSDQPGSHEPTPQTPSLHAG
jgi:hypothetical protein